MLIKLALRNIFRHRLRAAMTLAAIIFGVSGLVLAGGFVRDIFVQLGEAIIHSQTGHIQLFRKEFLERGTRHADRYLIEQPDALAHRIAAHPDVDQVAARLSFAGLLNNGRRDLAIIGEGVEAEKETRLGTYLNIIRGRQLASDDDFGMLIGDGVAHALSLQPGAHVTLLMNTADGALNTLDFEITGVFQSFSKEYDARAVRIPLKAAQELLAKPGANVLVVSLHRTGDTETVMSAIRGNLPDDLDAQSWQQLSDFYDKAVELYDRQFGVLQLIILFMVLLSVTNSVNMSTFERRAEFGTLQALGNTRKQVLQLILAENLMLGAIGATVGVAVGIVLALTISAIGIPMPPPPNANVGYTAHILLDVLTIFTAFVIGFVATMLAALFPAYRVSAMPVVDALQQGT